MNLLLSTLISPRILLPQFFLFFGGEIINNFELFPNFVKRLVSHSSGCLSANQLQEILYAQVIRGFQHIAKVVNILKNSLDILSVLVRHDVAKISRFDWFFNDIQRVL